MPRPIVPRKGDYRDDALAVVRIAKALELERECDPHWLEQAKSAADSLLRLLLSPDRKRRARSSAA